MDKIKEFFIAYYGPANPQQKWFILLTVLAFFWFPRNTRRLAGILFVVACVCWFIAHFLMIAFYQYTPH